MYFLLIMDQLIIFRAMPQVLRLDALRAVDLLSIAAHPPLGERGDASELQVLHADHHLRRRALGRGVHLPRVRGAARGLGCLVTLVYSQALCFSILLLFFLSYRHPSN